MSTVRRRSFLASIAAWLANLAARRAIAQRLPVEGGSSSDAASWHSIPGTQLDGRTLPPDGLKGSSFWFTDVAGRSQFAYRTNNDFTGRKYFPQPMCGGVAAIDYNNDGLMDLFFTNGAKLPELEKTSPAYYN